MPLDLISVRQATEAYGYSGSHIRNLLAKGVIKGEKIASVWLVDPLSVEAYQARMERLGNKKHGTWASGGEQEEDEAL
ncbi:MAG: hypothetical protein ACOC6F_03315 [bacterium]